MGTIKILKENNLTGGSSEDAVYPVTSDLAVFDEKNNNIGIYHNSLILDEETNLQSAVDIAARKVPSSKQLAGFKIIFRDNTTNKIITYKYQGNKIFNDPTAWEYQQMIESLNSISVLDNFTTSESCGIYQYNAFQERGGLVIIAQLNSDGEQIGIPIAQFLIGSFYINPETGTLDGKQGYGSNDIIPNIICRKLKNGIWSKWQYYQETFLSNNGLGELDKVAPSIGYLLNNFLKKNYVNSPVEVTRFIPQLFINDNIIDTVEPIVKKQRTYINDVGQVFTQSQYDYDTWVYSISEGDIVYIDFYTSQTCLAVGYFEDIELTKLKDIVYPHYPSDKFGVRIKAMYVAREDGYLTLTAKTSDFNKGVKIGKNLSSTRLDFVEQRVFRDTFLNINRSVYQSQIIHPYDINIDAFSRVGSSYGTGKGFQMKGTAFDNTNSVGDVNLIQAEIGLVDSNQPIAILLSNSKAANITARTMAVYDYDTKALIWENSSVGDFCFIVTKSCYVRASCDGIYKCNIVYPEKGITPFKKIGGSILSGKSLWTLWDSLGHNTWQEYFKALSGMLWDAELNIKSDKPISMGGTSSLPQVDDGTQARAINLVSYKDNKNIDVVLIENVNDKNYLNIKGEITDKPFMRSQKLVFNTGSSFNSWSEANDYVNQNLTTIINSFDSGKRKLGTILAVPYSSNTEVWGSKITFLTTATTEGDITINWAGRNYNVHVTPSMSKIDIINECLKYSYGSGTTDMYNGDGQSMNITYYMASSYRVIFNGNNTGVTASVSDVGGSGYCHRFFFGDNVSQWTDTSYWKETCSLMSTYKGLIEYLKNELPKALIYFVMPFSVNVDFSSSEFKNSDGSWSIEKFKKSEVYSKQKELYDIQKEVCNYYDIPYLDITSTSGMSICNIETFFRTNDVHPNEDGYRRYAETIFNYIK